MNEQPANTGIGDGSYTGHNRSKRSQSDNPGADPVSVDQQVDMNPPEQQDDQASSFATVSSPLPNQPRHRKHTQTEVAPTLSSPPSDSFSTPPPPRVDPSPTEPPVTKATLSELDVTKIVHNPKLRHDINFDPELHFRPNLDGEKGKRKQDRANYFWTVLENQLAEFATDPEVFAKKYGDEQWCLPLLLRSVKEIIQTLVPDRDRVLLDEGLNVELLMQQFGRGIADLERLAKWLSSILKSHCAPMRDEWVDEMYNELSVGNRTNDMGMLVKGMRSLLSVLEAMKLDVANHQIRCLRPALIEETVKFEQRFHDRKIQTGRLVVDDAKDWYESSLNYAMIDARPTKVHLQRFGETANFFERLARLLFPSHAGDRVPTTFLFDEERLIKLRSDMHDAIAIEVCVRVFEYEVAPKWLRIPSYVTDAESDAESGYFDHVGSSARSSSGSGGSCGISSTTAGILGSSIASGIRGGGFSMESDLHGDNSRPSSLYATSENGSDTGSTIWSSASTCTTLPSLTATDFTSTRTKSRKLYKDLVALVQTASPAPTPKNRWRKLLPNIAAEVHRHLPNAPLSRLQVIEDRLEYEILSQFGAMFQQIEKAFFGKLLTALANRVQDFKHLSGVALFSAATSPNRGLSQSGMYTGSATSYDSRREDTYDENLILGPDNRGDSAVEDMATRLAHLGILHWRVWADLVYIDRDPSGDVEMS